MRQFQRNIFAIVSNYFLIRTRKTMNLPIPSRPGNYRLLTGTETIIMFPCDGGGHRQRQRVFCRIPAQPRPMFCGQWRQQNFWNEFRKAAQRPASLEKQPIYFVGRTRKKNKDLFDTYIAYKRENEVDPVR